jgi:hypothetical protein
MDLKNSIKELNNNYVLKTNIPEWFVPAFKTLLSRNVTISSWNDLIRNLQNIVSDTKSVQDFVNRLSENLESGDLSKLLKNVTEETVDSNYKYIVLEYVNGTTDRVQVPSDYFVNNVNDFIQNTVGDGFDKIVTEDKLSETIRNFRTELQNSWREMYSAEIDALFN